MSVFRHRQVISILKPSLCVPFLSFSGLSTIKFQWARTLGLLWAHIRAVGVGGDAHFSDVPSIIICAAYAEVPELLQHMKRNYQFWKEQEIMGVTGLPPEHIIPLTPTELVRKIEFEALAECKETVEPAEDK